MFPRRSRWEQEARGPWWYLELAQLGLCLLATRAPNIGGETLKPGSLALRTYSYSGPYRPSCRAEPLDSSPILSTPTPAQSLPRLTRACKLKPSSSPVSRGAC